MTFTEFIPVAVEIATMPLERFVFLGLLLLVFLVWRVWEARRAATERAWWKGVAGAALVLVAVDVAARCMLLLRR